MTYYLLVRYMGRKYWAWTNGQQAFLSSDIIAAEAYETEIAQIYAAEFARIFPGAHVSKIACDSKTLIPSHLRKLINC